jgi:metacaspase-1
VSDKALLLGVNDYKSISPLRGCVNDVENMKKLLVDEFGFEAKNVKTLLNQRVVKDEVSKQMKWLFRDAGEGDRLVFHFSGHGSYTADLDGDEDGGADELICLYDMDFNDADTYLLDDELRRWTGDLPTGAQLTIVLDSCHSGTGTRLVLAPVPGKPQQQVAMRVDDKATLKRAMADRPAGTRGLDLAEEAAAALTPGHENQVRVRFVDPSPAIKEAVARRKRKRTRGLVIADMNHVLLAACRDNQTAADASLGGQPNGAFTYNLCQVLREGGAELERQALIDRVERALRDGQFDQVPQLEGRTGQGPLFGRAAAADDGRPDPGGVTVPARPTGGRAKFGELADVLDRVARLAPEAQREAVRLLGTVVGSQLAPRIRAVGGRHIVYVHGICEHPRGFSDPWWAALDPFTDAFGQGVLDDTRDEVLWSDLVNGRGVRATGARDASGQEEWAARVRGVLEERAAAEALEAAPGAVTRERARDLLTLDLAPRPRIPRDASAARGLSIPGLRCVDDFTVYMFNDAVRAQVVGRFTGVVRRLLEEGAELDVISHSWGTVVAYEGLRELEDAGLTSPQVRNLFTVGSALSIFLVKMRLRPANRDGRKPALVRRWVNLNAKGDPVGGPLQGRPYEVDEEFLGLANLGCGIFDASCAHGSYFKPDNDAVNRDIFANFIDRA